MTDVFANIIARQSGSTPRLSLRKPARFEAAPASNRSSLRIPATPSPSREPEQDSEVEAELGVSQPQVRRSHPAMDGVDSRRSATVEEQQTSPPEPTPGIVASAAAGPSAASDAKEQPDVVAEPERPTNDGLVALAEPEPSGLSVRPTDLREPATIPQAYAAPELPAASAPKLAPRRDDRAARQPTSRRQLSAQELLQRHFAPALVAAGHLSQAEASRLVPVPTDQPLPRARPGQLPVRLDPVDLPEQTGRRGDVHVHIDHVEISRPPTPAPVAQAAPEPTKVDHTAYLKRQARRTQR